MRRDFLEIMAGTKGWSFGRDHDDAHLIILPCLIESDGERGQHRVTETVAGQGVVERQPQYALMLLALKDLVHSPSSARSLSFSV